MPNRQSMLTLQVEKRISEKCHWKWQCQQCFFKWIWSHCYGDFITSKKTVRAAV